MADQGPATNESREAAELAAELESLRADALRLEEEARGEIDGVHESYRESARNLLHYVALRRRDIRGLQERLAALGLSSLGRAESHVLSNLNRVLSILGRLAGQCPPPAEAVCPGPNLQEGRRSLERHAADLLGPHPRARRV